MGCGLGDGGSAHEAGHMAPAAGPGELSGDLPDRRRASSIDHLEDLRASPFVVLEQHANAVGETAEAVLVRGQDFRGVVPGGDSLERREVGGQRWVRGVGLKTDVGADPGAAPAESRSPDAGRSALSAQAGGAAVLEDRDGRCLVDRRHPSVPEGVVLLRGNGRYRSLSRLLIMSGSDSASTGGIASVLRSHSPGPLGSIIPCIGRWCSIGRRGRPRKGSHRCLPLPGDAGALPPCDRREAGRQRRSRAEGPDRGGVGAGGAAVDRARPGVPGEGRTAWRKEHQCATCHHGTMTVWAQRGEEPGLCGQAGDPGGRDGVDQGAAEGHRQAPGHAARMEHGEHRRPLPGDDGPGRPRAGGRLRRRAGGSPGISCGIRRPTGRGPGRRHRPGTGRRRTSSRTRSRRCSATWRGAAGSRRLQGPVRGPREPGEGGRVAGEERAHRHHASGRPAVARQGPRGRVGGRAPARRSIDSWDARTTMAAGASSATCPAMPTPPARRLCARPGRGAARAGGGPTRRGLPGRAPASRWVLADDVPRPSGSKAFHQCGPHHLFRQRMGHARPVAVRDAARRGRLDPGSSSGGDGAAPGPPAEPALLRRRGRPGGLPDRLAHLGEPPGPGAERPAEALRLRAATSTSCAERNHNVIRLWAWEQARWAPWSDGKGQNPTDWFIGPNPYARTGPGKALDGKPKFDLEKWDDAYFDRLRTRVRQAGERGIYVSVMLFQGWSSAKGWLGGTPWRGHPYHPDNNVQGFNGNTDGRQRPGPGRPARPRAAGRLHPQGRSTR